MFIPALKLGQWKKIPCVRFVQSVIDLLTITIHLNPLRWHTTVYKTVPVMYSKKDDRGSNHSALGIAYTVPHSKTNCKRAITVNLQNAWWHNQCINNLPRKRMLVIFGTWKRQTRYFSVYSSVDWWAVSLKDFTSTKSSFSTLTINWVSAHDLQLFSHDLFSSLGIN